MIVLEVQDYCHDCPSFEADVQRPEKIFADINEIVMSNTIIHCEHRVLCERLKRYFESAVIEAINRQIQELERDIKSNGQTES